MRGLVDEAIAAAQGSDTTEVLQAMRRLVPEFKEQSPDIHEPGDEEAMTAVPANLDGSSSEVSRFNA